MQYCVYYVNNAFLNSRHALQHLLFSSSCITVTEFYCLEHLYSKLVNLQFLHQLWYSHSSCDWQEEVWSWIPVSIPKHSPFHLQCRWGSRQCFLSATIFPRTNERSIADEWDSVHQDEKPACSVVWVVIHTNNVNTSYCIHSVVVLICTLHRSALA